MIRKNLKKGAVYGAISLTCCFFLIVLTQSFWAHRRRSFFPDYPQVSLSLGMDPEDIFLQTGLGPAAIWDLAEEGDTEAILAAQESMFHPAETECSPLLGWFTREDHRRGGLPPVAVQPGDILVTFSTHTLGWRHGHAGLVIDENTVLESTSLGSDSVYQNISHWGQYASYAVLRPKGVSDEIQAEVTGFAAENLNGVPYRLTAGLFGEKAPEPGSARFGMQCAYLVWYAWQQFGYDLDQDGGRLVTPMDLFLSEQLEVVQAYGMDPGIWLEGDDPFGMG